MHSDCVLSALAFCLLRIDVLGGRSGVGAGFLQFGWGYRSKSLRLSGVRSRGAPGHAPNCDLQFGGSEHQARRWLTSSAQSIRKLSAPRGRRCKNSAKASFVGQF